MKSVKSWENVFLCSRFLSSEPNEGRAGGAEGGVPLLPGTDKPVPVFCGVDEKGTALVSWLGWICFSMVVEKVWKGPAD